MKAEKEIHEAAEAREQELQQRVDWLEGELAKADEWKAHNRALQQRVEELQQERDTAFDDAQNAEADRYEAEAREQALQQRVEGLFRDADFNGRACDEQRQRAERAEELADKYKWQVRDTCTRAEAAEARERVLREALIEAREDVAHWAGYADDYFKEKHDLAGDLARIDAALSAHKEGGE